MTAVSTGLSECSSAPRVAPSPASKARYIAPNCRPFITKPTRQIRSTVARSARSGPATTRASTATMTVAAMKRQPTRLNGFIAVTP